MRTPDGSSGGHTFLDEKVTAASGRAGIQRKSAKGGAVAAGTLASGIRSPGRGSPLPPMIRARVEPVLGADLSHVRVHDDAVARRAAGALQAKAFTHRHHIWLGPQQSSEDLPLMAHEATHVVQQGASPGLIQRTETAAAEAPPASTEQNPEKQTFGFSEEEMEARLSSTPGAAANAPTVEVEADTKSTLKDVETEGTGEQETEGTEGTEGDAEGKGGGADGEEDGAGGRKGGRDRARAGGGGEEAKVPETPGPASEFEGLVGEDVAAYQEGNLSEERRTQFDPRTKELLDAVDLLGDRSITDPDASALQGLKGEGLEPGAPKTGYEGEPLWLRTLATIRDVTGQLGGIVGMIGLVATVSGFILSLLMPPVGAFLLTVGKFCDVAALILDGVSLFWEPSTGYNLTV